jgi:hypothetical protein
MGLLAGNYKDYGRIRKNLLHDGALAIMDSYSQSATPGVVTIRWDSQSAICEMILLIAVKFIFSKKPTPVAL